jgi:hypothetical protein
VRTQLARRRRRAHRANAPLAAYFSVASTQLLRERQATVRTAVRAFREARLASRDDPRLGLGALLDHAAEVFDGSALAEAASSTR